MPRGSLLIMLLGVAACTAGPSGDGTAVTSDALVEGHGGITGPVDVQDGKLVVLRAGNEGLLERQGGILVGGAQGGQNPQGFLRKIVSAAVIDDDHIAITTADAALADAITTGSVAASHVVPTDSLSVKTLDNGTSSSSPAGLDVTIGETTVLDWHTHFHDPTNLLPVSDFDLSRVVKLTHAEVHFAPTVDFALAIEDHEVSKLDAVASGTLDASFDLDVETSSSIDLNRDPGYEAAIQKSIRSPALTYTLFETEPYVLPAQWVGWVPVVETVRFRVALECDLDLVSASHLTTGGTVHTTAAFGARYQDGTWTSAGSPSLDAQPRFALTTAGDLSGMCDVRTELGFYLYDLAGPTLSVSPYVTFDIGGGAWNATPGIRGAFGGRLQVLGWQLARADFSLFDARSANVLRGTY